MKIGIVEVCESNHYTAVSALALTYLTNKDNEVVIFTTPKIEALFNDLKNRATVITISESQTIQQFLAYVRAYSSDRIDIYTLPHYF